MASTKDFDRRSYFPGNVYDVAWLEASARRGKRLDPDVYRLTTLSPKKAGRSINFKNSRPIYSIREALSLFDILKTHQREHRRYLTKRGMSKKFWQHIEEKQYIPGRTEESLRSFYKKWSELYQESPELFIERLIEKSYPYSLNQQSPRQVEPAEVKRCYGHNQ